MLLAHTSNCLLQSLDKVVLVLGCLYIWWKKPTKAGSTAVRSSGEPETVVAMPEFKPVVLVQIPMCNERECFRQSITAACRLDWPQDKLVIQVSNPSFFV